jgi:hypothetical protein
MDHPNSSLRASNRARIAYYLARGEITLLFVVSIINWTALSLFYHLQGDSQAVIDCAILSIGCIVLLILWFNIEAEWFPSPPEGTNQSRKDYLTQPGGYFDDPIRFLFWVGWGIPLLLLTIAMTWLTMMRILGN